MESFIEGTALWLLRRQRKNLKAVILLFALHLLGLIALLVGLQSALPDSAAVPLVGIAWIAALVLLGWLRGGLALDTVVALSAARQKQAAAISKTIIGFLAVEFFILLCFCLIPFGGKNFGLFVILLVASCCYFLFRLMAGEKINWNSWVWVPASCILLTLFRIAKSAYLLPEEGLLAAIQWGEWTAFLATKNGLLTLLVAAIIVAYILAEPKGGSSGKHPH